MASDGFHEFTDEQKKLFTALFIQSALQSQHENPIVKPPTGQQVGRHGNVYSDSDVDMPSQTAPAPLKSSAPNSKHTHKPPDTKAKSKNHPSKPLGVTKLPLPRKPIKTKKPKASRGQDFSSIERSESPPQTRPKANFWTAANQQQPRAKSSSQSSFFQARASTQTQPGRKEKLLRQANSKVSYIPKKKFILGLDYGTTFTSVSYYSHSVDDFEFTVLPGDIRSIQNWPMRSGEIRQVPTQSWYPLVPRCKAKPLDNDQSEYESDTEMSNSSNCKINWSTKIDQHGYETLGSNIDNDRTETFLWGYEVEYHMYEAGTTRNVDRFMDRPKLMLVRTKHTEADRTKLRPRLSGLIRSGIVHGHGESGRLSMQDLEDVIADYLIRVFQHTKEQLQENEGLRNDSEVEFVMTVPAIWHQGSSRVMQKAIATAVGVTGLGTLSYGSIDNLFVATEPESAATYLMGVDNELTAGDTIVVLDCGGGTVDAAAFDISSSYPLRLKNEVGLPIGDNCGASYLNDNFEARVLERLADETYLDVHGETRESIAKRLVPTFERIDKRNKDVTKRPAGSLKIPGLRGDVRRGLTGPKAKRFEDNRLLLDWQDYEAIFMPILHGVGKLLRTQLEMAFEKKKMVQKVFLIGGFGAAPSLRSYLQKFLEDLVHELSLPYDIELATTSSQDSVSAIASGAVLRALNKTGGPIRRAESSYGFLRREPYQPHLFEEHRVQTPQIDPFDGQKFVMTIDYFIVKGMVLKPLHKFGPFTCEHAFELSNEELRCEEVLYVADFAKRSHFHPGHAENKGAQVAGKIVTSMKDFRSPEIVVLPDADEDGEIQGEPHYQVSYDLIPVIEGRNLRYETKVHGKVRKTCQISIASAFRPGTD